VPERNAQQASDFTGHFPRVTVRLTHPSEIETEKLSVLLNATADRPLLSINKLDRAASDSVNRAAAGDEAWGDRER
jgi:hypothetical protein